MMTSSPLPDDVPSALRSLLAACKESPDDPLPRQVLADWLDEHGRGDLAECVRLSWQAEQLHEYDPRRRLFGALTNDPARPAGRWLAGLRRLVPRVEFHNGLLRVRATPAELLSRRREDALLAAYRPWLETLRLRGFRSGAELLQLARAWWLRPFTVLDLDQTGLLDDSCIALLRGTSPGDRSPLHRVRVLSLRHGHLTTTLVTELTDAPERVPALRSLILHNNRRIGDYGVKVLAASPHLAGLVALDLMQNRITDAGAAVLLGWRPGGWAMIDVAHTGMSKDTVSRLETAGLEEW